MPKKKSKVTIRRRLSKPAKCYFCEEKKTPWFSETAELQRFLTERGKIISRSRNGLCSMHQRRLSTAIKHARHLALLSFVVRD